MQSSRDIPQSELASVGVLADSVRDEVRSGADFGSAGRVPGAGRRVPDARVLGAGCRVPGARVPGARGTNWPKKA